MRSILGVGLISVSLPCPVQAHLALYIQLLHGHEMILFIFFSPTMRPLGLTLVFPGT